jgi:hypothetical protein
MIRLILLLLLTGVFGCHRSIDLTDPLYRTWQLTSVRFSDGRVVSQSPDDYTITTFVPNGTILYGANGRNVACCSPHRFKRKGNVLDFTDVKSIPEPPVDNAEQCNLVDCFGPGTSWQILMLSADVLVIETSFGVATYRPYP